MLSVRGRNIINRITASRPEELKYVRDLIQEDSITPILEPEYNTDYSEINLNLKGGGLIAQFDDGGEVKISQDMIPDDATVNHGAYNWTLSDGTVVSAVSDGEGNIIMSSKDYALANAPKPKGNKKNRTNGGLTSEGNIYVDGEPMDLTQEIEVNPTTGKAHSVVINGNKYYIEDEKLAKGITDMGDDFLPTLFKQLDPRVIEEAGWKNVDEFVAAMNTTEGVTKLQNAHNTINPDNPIRVDGMLGEQTLRLGLHNDDLGGDGLKNTWTKTKGLVKKHAYDALTLLKGGVGVYGIGKAFKAIPTGEQPRLTAQFRGYMQRAKELSESGIDPVEKARMQQELSNTYQVGVKNAMRASGGSRGAFLANAGVLNANRVGGLLKLAALDNEAARENMKNYGSMLKYQEDYLKETKQKTRDMEYDESKRQSDMWGELGSGLLGMAFDDLAYAQESKMMKPYYDALVNNADMSLFEHQAGIDNSSLSLQTGGDE